MVHLSRRGNVILSFKRLYVSKPVRNSELFRGTIILGEGVKLQAYIDAF